MYDFIFSTPKKSVLVYLTFLFCNPAGVRCANILFFHGVSTYSHRVQTYELADSLEKRGHHVTYISPYFPRGPYINPNIREIVPEELAKKSESFFSADFDINLRVKRLIPRNVFAFYPTAVEACELLLQSKEFLSFLEDTENVDLVILDNCSSECGLAIVHKFKAKFIIFNVIAMIPSDHDVYGVAPESGAIPELEIDLPSTPMTFLERVWNALISIHFRYVNYNYVKKIDELIRKHLGYDDMPFLDDIVRNTSLILYTGDVITDFTRSHPPIYVNVGGLHLKNGNPKALPTDMKAFIENDSNSDGFVYISLGSAVTSSNLPQHVKNVFIDAIESFPNLKFLWKWNGPLPDKVPKNLYFSKWYPQMDLLAHPKIKAFITQSGRPSMLESLNNAVPMIAFPVLGDQDVNARKMEIMGGNVVLEIGTVTEEELKDALKKVVYDKRMKERMLELQRIFLDNPMSPISKAIYWTEYVLRHNNTFHLRSASFDQYWYQRRNIDVWAFIFTIIVAIVLAMIGTIGFAISLFRKCLKNQSYTNKKIKLN